MSMRFNLKRRMRFTSAAVVMAATFALVAGFVPASAAAQAELPPVMFSNLLTSIPRVDKTAGPVTGTLGAPTIARQLTATAIRTTDTGSATYTARRTVGTPSSSTSSSGDELSEARAILARYIAKYPILQGTTVSFGDARGYQAISYYQSGRIVISTTHTASLERIIGHEIWHIIDWRDNGVINWGENVPPN